VNLADALERAAAALPEAAEALRDANGDPHRVLDGLGAEGAARVLAWALREEPEAGEELLEAWSGRDEAPGLLQAVSEEGLPKPARKALRRARHQLRSRGVELAESAPAPRVARVGSGEESVEGAFVSPIDPGGARVLTLIEDNPGGGARLVQVVTDARRGVAECDVVTTTRGRARRFAREITSHSRFRAVAVPREAVRALLLRAVERQAPDRPLPRAFAELRSHLLGREAEAPGAGGEPATTPGERVRRELGEPEARPAAERRAVELLLGQEILPWIPPMERLREVVERLEQAEEGPVVVSGATREARRDSILQRGAEEVFGGEEGALVAEWLEETAFLLWQEGREEDARALLGAAPRVLDSEGEESELRRALLELALEPILARLREADEGEPPEGSAEDAEGEGDSLLVKP